MEKRLNSSSCDKKMVDLSFPIHSGMMTYPAHWHPAVEIKPLGRLAREGRASACIRFGTHTGTHMDAPSHFIADGKNIDEAPLTTCIGQARLISFHKRRKKVVDTKDLQDKLSGVGRISRLLIRFDWSDHFGKPDYYSEYPYFTQEACQWIVDQGIQLLGLDTPSPDNPLDNRSAKQDSPNHKLLLGQGVFLLEYLTNLRALKGPSIYLMALPLKIVKGDGAPARVVAYDQ